MHNYYVCTICVCPRAYMYVCVACVKVCVCVCARARVCVCVLVTESGEKGDNSLRQGSVTEQFQTVNSFEFLHPCSH